MNEGTLVLATFFDEVENFRKKCIYIMADIFFSNFRTTLVIFSNTASIEFIKMCLTN